MAFWNTGCFLVVKTWWMKVTFLLVAVLALWGLIDLLKRCYARLLRWCALLWSTAVRYAYSPVYHD